MILVTTVEGRWSLVVSNLNRSFACEEIEESQDFIDFFPRHYLSIVDSSTPVLMEESVVTVSGNVTVSF